MRVVICSRSSHALHNQCQRAGIDVHVALTVEEAIQAVESCHAQSCLIDYQILEEYHQLVDDSIFTTISNRVAPAQCVILCHPSVLQEHIEESHRSAVLVAHDPDNDVMHKIYKAIEFPPKKQITITPPERWQMVVEGLAGKFEEHEMRWVLDHLLSEVSTLRIRGVPDVRPWSVIINARFDDRQYPVIIKIARKMKIKKEVENYRNYIHHQMGHTHYANLENSFLGYSCGATVSNRLGGENKEQTFSAFYGEQLDREVKALLVELFENILKKFYQASSFQNLSVYDAYAYLDYEHIFDRLNAPYPPFPDLPDPARWLQAHKLDALEGIFYKPAHGDLWGDNIIVENGNPWLIDFERTGPHHCLCDFVELEADIVTRLFSCEDPELYDQLIACLSVHTNPQERLPYWTEDIKTSPAANKAFGLVDYIRSAAAMLNKREFEAMEEYYWALLIDLLFIASQKKPIIQHRALRYAALLCKRLEAMPCQDTSWLPESFCHYSYKPTPR
jgi:hypothetical protein